MEETGVDERIIFKWITKEWFARVWTELNRQERQYS
jgi:hypothetical protein